MPPLSEEAEDRLLTDATARITWGDFPGDVCGHLIRQGMDPEQARKLVNRLARERSAEVRRRSALKLAAGAGMILAALVFFGLLPWRQWSNDLNQWSGSSRRGLGSMLLAIFGGLGVTGLWGVWRGIWGLLLPQSEELTDVTTED
jgi:hypothetical protein